MWRRWLEVGLGGDLRHWKRGIGGFCGVKDGMQLMRTVFAVMMPGD